MTTVFTRLASVEIPAANLLLKEGASADYADLAGAGDTPIGISSHQCDANYSQTCIALDAKIMTLTASGAIAFGADCGLDTGGKVCTWTSGLKLGRAVSESSADGDEIEVALAASAVAPSPVEVLISATAPTVAPGTQSGTSAFVLHYTTSFHGLYFWNGASWEQLT